MPPGQHLTRDWPTLDLGLTPNISRERWRLDVYGAIDRMLRALGRGVVPEAESAWLFKIAENLAYFQFMPYTDRLDYFNSMASN